MPLAPVDWSIVVAGYWNPAIFTPRGIVRDLFQMEEATPINVQISLDAPLPYKVTCEGVTVSVVTTRLTAAPERNSFDSLARAMEIARRAVERFPVTPFQGVGVNIRYRSEQPVPALDPLLAHDWDGQFADIDLAVVSRGISRSLQWLEGKINLLVGQDEESQINFNIERMSTNQPEILAWLNTDVAVIRQVVERIVTDAIRVDEGEIQYEQADD